MNVLLKNNSKLIALLLLCFLTRFLLYVIFKPWQPEMEKQVVLLYDAIGYNNLAVLLLKYHHIKQEVLRTPIYPAFIAGIYTVFGVKPYLVLFIQIILSVGTAYFFYRIVEILSNTTIALIALFIFAIDPTLILYTSFLYSEVLFMFFTLWSLYLLSKGLKEKRYTCFIYSGVILGLATLTRPAGQYLIVVYTLIIILYTIKSNLKIRFSLLIVLFYLLSITPWAMRNYILHDRFKLSSTMEHNALILSSFYTEFQNSKLPKDSIINNFLAEVKAIAPDHLKDEMPTNLIELNKAQSFQKTEVFAKVANKYLMNHKKEFILAQLRGAINLHINMGTEQFMLRLHQPTVRWDIRDKVSLGLFAAAKKFFATKTVVEIVLGLLILLLLAFVYLFTLVGIFYTLKTKNFYILIFCLLNIGYFVALSSIYPTPRFRNPFMPFYIFLASFGIYHLWQELRQKQIEV